MRCQLKCEREVLLKERKERKREREREREGSLPLLERDCRRMHRILLSRFMVPVISKKSQSLNSFKLLEK